MRRALLLAASLSALIADAFRRSAAVALRRLQLAKANGLLSQAAKAQAPAYAAISGFGFQVCYQQV